MANNRLLRKLFALLGAAWLTVAAWPSTVRRNDAAPESAGIRIGLLNVDGHAWWFGGFFNPYDEARLEKNFPRAAERNRLIRGVALPFPNARIVKVWGGDRKAVQEFAATFDNPEVVEKPEDMLGTIDAVMLVNAGGDGNNHLDLIRPFLERGIPAYIDKPMAFTGETGPGDRRPGAAAQGARLLDLGPAACRRTELAVPQGKAGKDPLCPLPGRDPDPRPPSEHRQLGPWGRLGPQYRGQGP